MTCPLARINYRKRNGLPIPPELLEAHREYHRASKAKHRAIRKALGLTRPTGRPPKHTLPLVPGP